MLKEAKKIDNLTYQEPNIYKIKNSDSTCSLINTEKKICSCFMYIDKGVFKHLIAACIKDNVKFNGLEIVPKTYKIKRKNLNNRSSEKGW